MSLEIPLLRAREDITSQRIFAVWARLHSIDGGFGRDKIVITLKTVLNQYTYQGIIARTVIERRGVWGLITLIIRYLANRGPKALQLLLYEDEAEIQRIMDQIAAYEPTVILIDTVRLIAIAEGVRKLLPTSCILIDMDDVMSRRYDELATKSAPLNLGFMARFVPAFLTKAAGISVLTRAIYRTEAKGLRAAEARALAMADAVALVSPAEGRLLEKAHPDHAAKIAAILPPATGIPNQTEPQSPPHFVFVGSDRLHQNAMTIDYLLDLWRRRAPQQSLHIFGKMTRTWTPPPNVTFMGFAPDVSKVYTGNALLLCPSFLAGGIKTKVLESFAYGIPVIGTALSFEGMDFEYPLRFADIDDLENFVMNVTTEEERLCEARKAGHTFVVQNCSVSTYEACWHDLIASCQSQPRSTSRMKP